MISGPVLLTNAVVVAPDRLFDRGTVRVEDGRIVDVMARTYPAGAGTIDLGGRFLLPGIVDLHNDAFEREIEPRRGAVFEPGSTMAHLDRALAAAGVTTGFHGVYYYGGQDSRRNPARVATLLAAVRATADDGVTMVGHRVLHRLDLAWPAGLDEVLRAVEGEPLPLVSLNHHAPGRGQYRDLAAWRRSYRKSLPADADEADEADLDALLADHLARVEQGEAAEAVSLERLAAAPRPGLVLASHDDDTPERVDCMREVGCTIAEFPVTVAAAERARYHGMVVVMGAPNVVRGGSQSGNVGGGVLLARGLVDVLAADYHAPSLLRAVFDIAAHGVAELSGAVRLVSAYPAMAVGLPDRGAITAGKRADLIVVECRGRQPLVAATFVAGSLRYAAGSFAAGLVENVAG